MKSKKRGIFLIFAMAVIILSLLFNLFVVSALAVTVSSKPVTDSIVNDHGKPAIFTVIITNNEPRNLNLEIYAFERFMINPNEINLSAGESKTLDVEFLPFGPMEDNVGYVTVPFYVKEKSGSDNVQAKAVIKLVDFRKAFELKSENINPSSNNVKVYFYNLENINYNNLETIFSSSFFDDKKETVNLVPYQRYETSIPINNDKIKKLIAGAYNIRATYSINGKTESVDGSLKILEKTGLSVNEQKSGAIIRKVIIEKLNEGNIPSVAEITINKNVISRLFTTLSLEPSRIERKGFFIYYTWQKELNPDEKLSVMATTNWTFPLIIVIFIVIIVFLIYWYTRQDVIIKKKINYVKTKSDEFALRVTIKVKARRFVEKVTLYDKLPGIVKLYEKFSSPTLTRVDETSGRIQWDIPKLIEGEERIFSYLMYSKLNVVGKFEIPSATAVYELNGKPGHAKSNRVFFVNEPRKIVEDKENRNF
ncbi:hypothetical protein J4466_03680 [Candidatus Pacearchaeota archaeon]|nr:hypothetical protein [Candidatus Pacearchaeota archaeon]